MGRAYTFFAPVSFSLISAVPSKNLPSPRLRFAIITYISRMSPQPSLKFQSLPGSSCWYMQKPQGTPSSSIMSARSRPASRSGSTYSRTRCSASSSQPSSS